MGELFAYFDINIGENVEKKSVFFLSVYSWVHLCMGSPGVWGTLQKLYIKTEQSAGVHAGPHV